MFWFITSSNFTIWGQIGPHKNARTRLRSPVLDENAFLMLQHERMRAWSCHCGLKQMPCFMTCNTVANLGTLDMARFTGGRHKHRKPQCWFSQPQSLQLKVTETHGPQGGWDKHLLSNKRNKSIVRRNKPSCQNTHKEAWTGKSSISTSWEIITPFWMCLWGQRGLCSDACTIYWGRSVQCRWSEPWTLGEKRVRLTWHSAFVI